MNATHPRVIWFSISLPLLAAVLGCGERGKSSTQPERNVPRLIEEQTPPDVVHDKSTAVATSDRERTRTDRLEQASVLMEQRKFADVSTVLLPILLKNPDDHEVIFHLANAHAAMGEYGRAIDLLADIPPDHPEAGLPSLGVSAGWCFETQRYDDAEERYLKILELNPSVNLARRQLAYLYNRQGRRHEAVRLIRQLCERGDVMQDELHALIIESDAMYDPPGSPPDGDNRVYWPIDEMGQARKLFTDGRYLEAADLVEPLVKSGKASHALIAFYGCAIVEAQADERLSVWLEQLSEPVKAFPEYWAALGTYLLRETRYEPALRAIAEAVRLDPTDLRSIRRLFQCLRSTGEPEKAAIWIEHYALMTRILQKSNAIASTSDLSKQQCEALALDLQSANRNLEAVLWRSIAASNAGDQKQLQALNDEMKQTLTANDSFPSDQEAWCEMNLGRLPLPSLPTGLSERLAELNKESLDRDVPVAPAAFRDVSDDVGLKHTYMIARQPNLKGFAIYQTFGGGVAILDFDLDGEQDIYLAQGAADPDEFVADDTDQLYRTVHDRGQRILSNVTEQSYVTDQAYTIGVTAGDWNQDGFPDLAVSNIGVNVLLINQTDGTFKPMPLDETPEFTRLSTSLAMGDVTGDGLPDLFALSFAKDAGIAEPPEFDSRGNAANAFAPLSIQATRDQIYENRVDGHWVKRFVGESGEHACTGLGVVMTDILHDRIGNEVFVANDVRNNQLWVPVDSDGLADQAIPFGCAYGSVGSATAAMGVAAADLDRNGTLDLHVTNFADQPVSLYMSEGDLFRDLNVQFKLAEKSTPMLGFGTQAIDYSNDGWPDLAVTNGHVEDLRHQSEEFHQLFQLFANRSQRFEQTTVTNCGYCEQGHLGRALARLDFNRDGKNDLIVTDMLGPTALLVNESETSHHWIAFRLVGTVCERDAIGARVIVETKQQQWTGWVTAGDGFLCKNESLVHFGIGENESLTKVTIHWPSGHIQDLGAVTADCVQLVVEDQEGLFELKP